MVIELPVDATLLPPPVVSLINSCFNSFQTRDALSKSTVVEVDEEFEVVAVIADDFIEEDAIFRDESCTLGIKFRLWFLPKNFSQLQRSFFA